MIEINGYTYSSETLEEMLAQVFWKQTGTTRLDTTEGCKTAAAVTARWLAALGHDYHPGGSE